MFNQDGRPDDLENIGRTPEDSGRLVPTIPPQSVPDAFWVARPRNPYVVGDIALVPLTKGYVAIIDAADVELVSGRSWHAREMGGRVYAVWTLERDGCKRAIYMHRLLGGVEPDDPREVDHREGVGLDNRRSNLRACSHQQNLANTGASRNNKLGLKGVWAHGRKFRASIYRNGKTEHLGGFDTPEEAAEAYAIEAKKHYGEFAR